MIGESKSTGAPEANCPKRPWVMTMFSDDEAIEPESLPPGLRFHLSRCPSCNALAERLAGTSAQLATLADTRAAGDLIDQANARVRRLLQEGPQLTGRVDIPEERAVYPLAGRRLVVSSPWVIGGAMAACLALLLVGGWLVVGSNERPRHSFSDPGRGWEDSGAEWMSFTRNDAVEASELDGPPVPEELDSTGALAEGDAFGLPRQMRPKLSVGADPSGSSPADSERSAWQGILDKPAQAVSTQDAAKER